MYCLAMKYLDLQLPANFDRDLCMQYLRKWGRKEMHTNEVNDEENVVGDINEVL